MSQYTHNIQLVNEKQMLPINKSAQMDAGHSKH